MHDGSISAAIAPAFPRQAGVAFFAGLALATILPLALLPASGIARGEDIGSLLLGFWIVTGFGHVMSTIWFGLDKDYEPIIDAHRGRMIASLAALPLATVALVLSLPEVANWAIAAYWVWQAHHYNRQNYGILSFAAAHDRTGPLPKQITWVLHLATCAGAINLVTMPAIYAAGLGTPDMIRSVDVSTWHAISALMLFAAAGLAIHLVATNDALRRSPMVLLFLLLSVVFYVPSFSMTSTVTAFWPYAAAHGAQYLIIMGVTAGRSRRGLAGLIIFMAIAYVLGVAAYMMASVPLAALYTGIVMWHFLADARLWRLRDPAVRAIVRSRFDFVFRPT